jgi:hypothetical protein
MPLNKKNRLRLFFYLRIENYCSWALYVIEKQKLNQVDKTECA